MASHAGENSGSNGFEHTMESSILTDLIFRRTAEKNDPARNILKAANSTRASQIDKTSILNSKIKDRTNAQKYMNPLMTILVDETVCI
jgi:hypothetical protein